MGYIGEKKREYQRIWIAARRAKWFDGKVCVVCGGVENLELDHTDPNTKVTHRIWSWSWQRIEEETAKCQVLCEQHHKLKTLENKEHPRGEQGSHKFTEEQVREIRRLRENGLTYEAIAKRFPFVYDKKTIWWVVNKDWKHLTD